MAPASGHSASSPGVASLTSDFAFAQTVQRLQAAFAEHGIKVFATIDQQAEAASAGLAMPPTTLIVFGNPKSGTPLMLERPMSGIDLPLKVLVLGNADGSVSAVFNTTAYLVERHALPPDAASKLEPALALIERAITR
jgi:uncharacterized protein (DUF302 family)